MKAAKPATGASASFKGNKQALPSKPCVACGLSMSWRKRWARSWDEVKYCSEACRRSKAASRAEAPNDESAWSQP